MRDRRPEPRRELRTPDHRNARKRRWGYLLLVFGWVVWISGIFGNSGLIQAYKLSQVRREITLRIRALENEKARLQTSVHALDHDGFIQELAIRETLGFVRDSELVFEFQ